MPEAPIRRLRLGLAACLVLLLAACAPAYDETADKLVIAAQQKFDEGATALIGNARAAEQLRRRTPPPEALAAATKKVAFAANQGWYDQVDTAVSTARIRVAADSATPAQIDQSFALIQDNLADLRSAHEKNDTIAASTLSAARVLINAQFKALMTYELQVKSGTKP